MDILYVFGSRAGQVWAWMRGELPALLPGPADVDVGVRPIPRSRFSVDEKVRPAVALEDLRGVARVDLVSLPEVDPSLAANIIWIALRPSWPTGGTPIFDKASRIAP